MISGHRAKLGARSSFLPRSSAGASFGSIKGRDLAADDATSEQSIEVERLAREWDAAYPSNPVQAQTPENDVVRVRAEAGDADAQYDLGVRYGTG
ncbi:MAG: hypothetical protein OSB03_16975 [Vicinamibacterales bacterium]|nr:hypothetical protein [Vicinamibacterales bacterium]